MIRTLTLISALALFTACANVGEELAEVPPAMTDQDGTWKDARQELSDVIDEMGDRFDDDKRIDIEDELDRQLQEIEESLNALSDETKQDIADADARLPGLQQAAEEARRDLEAIPEVTDDGWKDASHGVALVIEDLEDETNKLRVKVQVD